MPATIRELINANVLNTIAGITTGTGYANTVGAVEWQKSTGNPQRYPDINGLYVCLVIPDGSDELRESRPISKDDYDGLIIVEALHAQSIDSNVSMADRNHSAWADIKKALKADHTRGTHPTNGGPLAFNTFVSTPSTIDTPSAQGVTFSITVWYRTARDDPYSQ